MSTGTVYIRRPGRVRFEYNNDKTLVVASGGNVTVVDPKSNGGPQQYPLSRTPLSIILARNVDLGRANMVTGYAEAKNSTVVTAQDPANPQYGNIQLVFTSPTELRQWIVNDANGGRTTVILGELVRDVRLADENFVIPGLDRKRIDR